MALTVVQPGVGGTGNTNLTYPSTGGTVMVSGNMPAFSAYATSNQATTSGVTTKILFGSKLFDTNNNFASSTFTPTVAGYYQINCQLLKDGSCTRVGIYIYKNGSVLYQGTDITASSYIRGTMSALIYMNGTTDYLEIYGYQAGGTGFTYSSGNTSDTWFNGCLVRNA